MIELGPKCPQEERWYDDSLETMSEDCLYLNVYSPCLETEEDEEGLAVMIWVHGGGSRRGSGGTFFYGPEYLLDLERVDNLEHGILLVTLNYRLIPFGFTSLESAVMPGNQGLRDQVLAFQWVQENIAQFGGDPERVTIFGESAGSWMVLSQLVSPLSAGLFTGVVAQSGSPTTMVPKDKQGRYRRTVLDLALQFGCSVEDDQAVVECLQLVDMEEFFQAATSLPDATYGMVTDADFATEPFMPQSPEMAMRLGQVNNASVVIGFNKDEGIYQIPPYVLDPTKLPNLNDNWDVLGPQLLFGKCCNFSAEEQEKAERVRQFYFGEEDISQATIHSLIDMFTDLTFWAPAHRAVQLLSSLPGRPVFEYLFSHQGAFSYADLTGLQNYSLGVAHADELHYLFNPHVVEFPSLAGEDFSVRDLMVAMWTSFAREGDPTYSGDLGLDWTNFRRDHPQYLDINPSPSMEYSVEFKFRTEFWENLFPLRPLVTTTAGMIQGRWATSEKGGAYQSFQGIPYGKVTERFLPPSEAEPWGKVLEAGKEGAACPQKPGRATGPGMSEDCLFVNVFVPEHEDGADLSVMVFIHGGAYVGGSGGQYYYGPQFLMDYGVILVTLNYRLGALGFLGLADYLAPGNAALWDQQLALSWVQTNIQAFGGDPARVTLFGESAGSFSVMYHLVSPRSRGLFSAAIAQSGAPFASYWSPDFMEHGKQRRTATDLARSLDCDVSSDRLILACLRERSYEDIINAEVFCHDDNICTIDPWNVVVDSYLGSPFLPDTPSNLVKAGEHTDVPLVIGVNSEEGIYAAAKFIKNPGKFSEINEEWETYGPLYIFDSQNPTAEMKDVVERVKVFYLDGEPASLETKHQVIDMFSDIVFWAGAQRFVFLAGGRQRSPIYQYLLSAKSSNSYARLVLGLEDTDLGVCHADDIYHLFKNYVHDMTFNSNDLMLRDFLLTSWTNFAKTRSPSPGLWTPVDREVPQYLDIGLTPQMTDYSSGYVDRMNFWMDILEELAENTT